MTDVIDTLIDHVRAEGVGKSNEINPFWRKQLERLGPALSAGPEAIRLALGYNAARLPEGCAHNADQSDWEDLIHVAKTCEIGDPKRLNGGANHAGQLRFLMKQGVFEDYLAWADAQGLMSNMDLGRLYWYGLKLRKALAERDAGQLSAYLEVGSGSGRLPMIMAQAGVARHYVLVDLPEMLINAALLVSEELPDVPLRYGETPDADAEPGFWLLRTSEISKVPTGFAGAAVNINSFMEMDEEIRDFYIDEIYRVLHPGGVFYNVNRRQHRMTRRDGSVFDSNPLLYPYRATDQIIEWEVDACQMTCKSGQFHTPQSYAISRMAEVR